jgi:hypothetical protein
MTAYGAVLALTGFNYSGVDNRMKFNPLEGKYFWANGQTYGTITLSGVDKTGNSNEPVKVRIDVLGEKPLRIQEFILRTLGMKSFKKIQAIEEFLEFEVKRTM